MQFQFYYIKQHNNTNCNQHPHFGSHGHTMDKAAQINNVILAVQILLFFAPLVYYALKPLCAHLSSAFRREPQATVWVLGQGLSDSAPEKSPCFLDNMFRSNHYRKPHLGPPSPPLDFHAHLQSSFNLFFSGVSTSASSELLPLILQDFFYNTQPSASFLQYPSPQPILNPDIHILFTVQ